MPDWLAKSGEDDEEGVLRAFIELVGLAGELDGDTELEKDATRGDSVDKVDTVVVLEGDGVKQGEGEVEYVLSELEELYLFREDVVSVDREGETDEQRDSAGEIVAEFV